MSSRKIIQATVEVDREVWFRFRTPVHANGYSLNRAVEGVLRETLRSAGIEITPEVGGCIRELDLNRGR